MDDNDERDVHHSHTHTQTDTASQSLDYNDGLQQCNAVCLLSMACSIIVSTGERVRERERMRQVVKQVYTREELKKK